MDAYKRKKKRAEAKAAADAKFRADADAAANEEPEELSSEVTSGLVVCVAPRRCDNVGRLGWC